MLGDALIHTQITWKICLKFRQQSTTVVTNWSAIATKTIVIFLSLPTGNILSLSQFNVFKSNCFSHAGAKFNKTTSCAPQIRGSQFSPLIISRMANIMCKNIVFLEISSASTNMSQILDHIHASEPPGQMHYYPAGLSERSMT